MSEWIKVDDELPPAGQQVLICLKCEIDYAPMYASIMIIGPVPEEDVEDYNITHWARIPELPQD